MTKPIFTDLHCSVCGRKMGKKPGIQVVLGLVCDDPICAYQPETSANEQRDALIVNSALAGVPVSRLAQHYNMSRQRIYQILDAWKTGV